MPRRSIPMRGRLVDAAGVGLLPDGLRLRRIEPGDAAGLGRLMAAAYRGTVDDPGQNDTWFTADAAATLRGRYGAVVRDAGFVACDEAELVGTSLVTGNGRALLLAFALVVPRWQRRGVGTALISASAAALQAQGHEVWTLAVTDGNPARALYERLGFRPDPSLRRARDGNSPA